MVTRKSVSRIFSALLIVMVLLTGVLPTQIASAGNNLWTPTGPYGVMIRSLAIAPNNNQVIYAGTDLGQISVFKSVDGGTTWSARNNGIPAGTSYGFAFDPHNSNIVYVATSTGLYKSIDAGEAWTLKSSTQIGGTAGTLIPWAIASSAVDSTLYLAHLNMGPVFNSVPPGIYRSRDGGETWELIHSAPWETFLAIAPSAPHIIYSGSWGGGIFKSTDGGDTWQEIDSSFGALPTVTSLMVDPHDAQVVYLGVSQNGIFKTTNGGQTWYPIGTSLGSMNADDIKIDPQNQQVIYAGGGDIGISGTTAFGVYRSLDNTGLSWTAMNNGMGSRSVYTLAIDNGSPQNMYAGTSNGVWKYTLTSNVQDNSISINNGALFTNQSNVTLNLTAPPGTTQMMLSNDGGFAGASWETFTNSKAWTITSYGNYAIPRTVYAKFRTSGQVSGLYQDDIILDVNPPAGTVAISGVGSLLSTKAQLASPEFSRLGAVTANLQLSATDDVSGVSEMIISSNPAFSGALWEPYRSSKSWQTDTTGAVTVYVRFRDNAGNLSSRACATNGATPCAGTVGGGDTTGVFRPINGLIYLKNLNDTGFADLALNYGIPGDYPVVGDWDGDGTATIGVYRNGQFLLRNSNTVGFADWVFAFGTPGDQPIAGDWDGDGIDTIGIYRPWTGQFLLRNSNSAGAAEMSFYLGNAGDVGIAGDWDRDGKDTTGVFRPINGIIFLKNTNETGFADVALNYGIPGDKPVTGDWDNDGIDTIGVYRNAQFMLRNSNTVGFADIVFGLGNPGDMPIAGNWDGLP